MPEGSLEGSQRRCVEPSLRRANADFLSAFPDCKDKLRNPEWKPHWIQEQRMPSFVDPQNRQGWQAQTKFGLGYHL